MRKPVSFGLIFALMFIPGHLSAKIFHQEPDTWHGAYMQCLSEGATLLQVTSASHNFDVVDLMGQNGATELILNC